MRDSWCIQFEGARVVGTGEAIHVASGRALRLFRDVPFILNQLAAAGVPLAVASASPASEVARRLLRAFSLPEFGAMEIHPGTKDVHLRAVAATLRVPLNRAIFFDDLSHNIRAAERLGVTCIHIQADGLSKEGLRQALRKLRSNGRGAGLMRAWMSGTSKISQPSETAVTSSSGCEAERKRKACGDCDAPQGGGGPTESSAGRAATPSQPVVDANVEFRTGFRVARGDEDGGGTIM